MSEVNIGPYHPFLLEPWKVDLVTEGDTIKDATITTGFVHRGIEKLLSQNPYLRGIHISERVCGICSTVHSNTFSQTVESMFGADVPERSQFIRVILLELERLHSHYLTLALMAHASGRNDIYLDLLKNRESVMNMMEAIAGNRVNLSAITIGGVKRDITPELDARLADFASPLKELSDRTISALEDGQPWARELEGIGVIDAETAISLGAVGPILRAAGLDHDLRKDDPYAAYGKLDFKVIIEQGGDVLARTRVRIRETIESLGLIGQCLDRMPEGPILGEIPQPIQAEFLGRSEAPRGELSYYFRANKTNLPERVKIRTPTFANHMALREMLRGEKLTNASKIIESIDPCLSCTDR